MVFIVEVCLDQIMPTLHQYPFVCPTCDVQLLSEARNFCFRVGDGLLQKRIRHVCDFELQFEGFNYKDLSESGIVFEVLVCDFYFCSPSLVKTLEFTLLVDGSQRLKLFAQLPEILG